MREQEPPSDPKQSGDGSPTESFVHLFTGSYRRVYACILSLLPDANEAEEVLQETSLVMWRKFDEFRPDGDFVRWACGIAYNQTRRYLREKSRRGIQLGEDVLERIAETHNENLDWLDTRRDALSACIEALAASDRTLLGKCYAGDETIKAVAEKIDRPANTVYKSLKRIRLSLLECVDRKVREEERP